MNSSTYRFALDMHSAQSQISVPVLYGDTGRTFRISLSDGGNSYIINDGCLAKLTIKRPTGTHIEEFCTIEGNTTIVYPFSQNTAAKEGIHECDVTLYDLDGEKITSPRFTMVVSERVINSDDIVLTDEDFTAVDAMIVKEANRQAKEAERLSAEEERLSAEEERKTAENGRISAEEGRVSAENKRASAENERMSAIEELSKSASASATSASNAASEAKESENKAKEYAESAEASAESAADSAEEASKYANAGIFKDRTIDIECVYGTINNSTGDSTTGGTKSTLITPDFLFAEVGKVKITASSQWHGFRVYEYDAEKNFLRVTAQQYKTTYTLSDDCKFFKLSIFKNSGENIDDIPAEIAYTTISFYGLDYELYGRFLNAKKVEADVNKLKYPQTGELFVFPPSEEYPFPTGLTSWGVKRNHLSTLYGFWDALVTLYPDYVTSETLGKDASGLYDIKAYTITSNNNKSLNSGNKQLKILYMSCIHGDEVNCAEEDYLYFKDLLENHETGNNRVLWDNVLFKIIPICNPWGYENLSRVNSNGVNLNRNFSGNWKYVAQSTSNNYSGESAMSEVETQIISNFIKNNSDAFFCFNRHGTEKFTDSGIIGYLASWWSVDAYVYKGMANRVNTAVKSAFDWVTSDKPVNKTRSIFDIQVTSTYAQRFTGTLDSHWTLVYGKHGALIELGFQGNVVGSDYPNGNGSDFMAICIKILSETLVYPVVFNNAILRSDSRYEI